MKKYCTQDGDCANCSLSSYGKDCHNMPIVTKKCYINVRTSDEIKEKLLNVSTWKGLSMSLVVEQLVRKEHLKLLESQIQI